MSSFLWQDLLPIVDRVESEDFRDVFTRLLHKDLSSLLEHLERAKHSQKFG